MPNQSTAAERLPADARNACPFECHQRGECVGVGLDPRWRVTQRIPAAPGVRRRQPAGGTADTTHRRFGAAEVQERSSVRSWDRGERLVATARTTTRRRGGGTRRSRNRGALTSSAVAVMVFTVQFLQNAFAVIIRCAKNISELLARRK